MTQNIIVDGVLFTIEDDDPRAAPALTLSQLQTQKCAAIDNYRDTIVNNGATYKGKVFQIDSASRANIDAGSLLASLAIQNMTANKITITDNLRWTNPNVDFGWIAEDNSILSLDAPSMIQFGQTMAGYYTELIFTARGIKNAINNLTTLDEVNNFDITQNWPSSTIG